VQPTIWTGLPETAAVVRRRSSARAATSALRHEEEVLALANATATAWPPRSGPEPGARAPRGRRIEVGITWINSWFLRDLRTPFGGSKQSGIGREGGVHSLEFYTELRNICMKL
jgi:aminomuconate-semialdehyde/2-hydroxymuconate-6-semialdehyde dehydrogenase